jgi:DNA-binding NarL/FixJ family response regulator
MAKTLASSHELCDLAADDPLPPDSHPNNAPRRSPLYRGDPELHARVLVVDDHPAIREGILELLGFEPDLICCGEAETIAGTAELVAKLAPDLVLMDLRLRDGDAFELIQLLKGRFPSLPVLVLSQSEEPVRVQRAMGAGARGYLLKQDAAQVLIAAMRSILRGGCYISAGARDAAPNFAATDSPAAQFVAR